MVVTCAVFGCKVRFDRKPPGCTFHKFPKNRERRLAWSRAVRGEGYEASDQSCICSEHFEERMFDRTGQTTRLREFAFPTIFPTSFSGKKRRIKPPSYKSNCLTAATAGPLMKCVFLNCRSNSESYGQGFMKDIFFIHVPSIKTDPEKRKLWLESSGRCDLNTDSSTDQFKYYICSKHFVDGLGPTSKHPDPIPYSEMPDQCETEVAEDSESCAAMEILTDQSEVVPSNSFVMSKLSDTSLPEHYVITVKSLSALSSNPYSITDIRANYQIPEGWTLCMTTNTIFFTCVNEETDCFLIKFVINQNMTTSVHALGKKLRAPHPLLESFPQFVSREETLNKCFTILKNFHPCCGNNETAYVSLFKQKQKTIRGVYNPRTAAVHCTSCELLTKDKTARCFACQLLRHLLKSRLETYLEKFAIVDNDLLENSKEKDM